MEITTKSPQKLYNGSFFGPFFTQKSFFPHWKVFDLKSLKQDSIYASTVNVSQKNPQYDVPDFLTITCQTILSLMLTEEEQNRNLFSAAVRNID